eukprot:Seg4353.3 transcript_id=Seg4353.3/GoldUCD/mRNA.D3Y31 product="Radical S-adenosyl methionine domain-containing protein 1 mitochondrial" protein_id=Seg4353.3/GoldUCD/D3Y31
MTWPNRTLKRYFCSSSVNDPENVIFRLLKTASVYVHWPYCKHICPYCNFNKYKSHNVDHRRMRTCLQSEIKRQLNQNDIHMINSVYFGGGTPSLCEISTIESVINDTKEFHQGINDFEISLEANPSSTEQLRSFKDAGINRVSIGVQALDDKDLQKLGRDHTVRDATQYIEQANKIFDGRISIDLMFGRPGQTLDKWRNELRLALKLSSNHVSLYQLTMERSTPMEKMYRRGEIKLPEPDEVGDMYNAAVEILENTGLKRYEVANFSKQGYESKHNKAYWNGYQYIGIGPGAHGRIHSLKSGNLIRTSTIQSLVPDIWMKQIETNGHGMVKVAELSRLQTLEEIILQGLRSIDGIDQKIFGAFADSLHLESLRKNDVICNLVSGGFLQIDNCGLRATCKGLGLIDSMVPDICMALEQLLNKERPRK